MRVRLGIRSWLTLAFAAVAGVMAATVAAIGHSGAEEEFRARAREVAAGRALQAAIDVSSGSSGRPYGVETIAEKRGIALFVFDSAGRLLSGPRSRGVPLTSIPSRRQAVAAALARRRFVETNEQLQATTIGLALRTPPAAALLAYVYHPDISAGLGIVRRQTLKAALWSVLLGGAVGFVLATLVATRVRRIADTAVAIAAGEFETPLVSSFPDEIGALAATVERMRVRLRASFGLLESERDRLRRLVERLREGVVSVARDGRVEFANEQARKLLHAPLQPGDALPPAWHGFALDGFARAVLDADEPLDHELSPDEDHVYVLVGLPPHDGADSAILVVADVSERERAQRAQREFVANAAHELRTPLTTIIGATEALQAGANDDPRARERFLDHIAREAGRLARLSRSLLVLARAQSRQEPVALAPVELRPLLDEIAGALRPVEGVRVEVNCPPGLAVLADRGLAERAVGNVAANAAQHTLEGVIELAARDGADGTVVIEVRDSGTGIPEGEREHVFDRFYRVDRGSRDGFGLGLAIAREAVHALGGTIAVEAAPDGGTIARVTLEQAVRA